MILFVLKYQYKHSFIKITPLVCSVLLMFSACSEPISSTENASNETATEHAKKHLDPLYVCPMHPKIMRNSEGTCPICGMALVEQEIKSANGEHPEIEISPGVMHNMSIKTAPVERGQLWKYIKTVGYVSYNQRRLKTVSSKTYGWVENLSVRTEGQTVKRGQLLLELYSPEFLDVQKDFIAAQKKDKSGILKKYGKREESVPSRDYLRYLDVPDSAMNEIARSGKPKYRIPIYAPQYGTVIRNNLHKHMYVEPGLAMFVIADLSTVWVEADVFEHQLDWIELGLKTKITVQALPGRSWEGQLTYIYPELDPRTRTLKVRLLVPNPSSELKPNMFAKVDIYGGPKKEVLKIPRQALIMTGERESVVLALGEGKFKPVDVKTGMRSGDEVEILEGLKEDDRIVTSGQFLIDSEANLQASFMRLNKPHE